MTMLRSLGLVGDGDEVDALESVERAFEMRFAAEDAEAFVSVGDVWIALCKALRLDESAAAPLWTRFAEAIGDETGLDPARVERSTRLLAEPLGAALRRTARRLFGRP